MNDIILVNTALDLVARLLPLIIARVKSGDVTVEEQQSLHDRYVALRQAGDEAFKGPEWDIE